MKNLREIITIGVVFLAAFFIYFQSQEAKKEWLQERNELIGTIMIK